MLKLDEWRNFWLNTLSWFKEFYEHEKVKFSKEFVYFLWTHIRNWLIDSLLRGWRKINARMKGNKIIDLIQVRENTLLLNDKVVFLLFKSFETLHKANLLREKTTKIELASRKIITNFLSTKVERLNFAIFGGIIDQSILNLDTELCLLILKTLPWERQTHQQESTGRIVARQTSGVEYKNITRFLHSRTFIAGVEVRKDFANFRRIPRTSTARERHSFISTLDMLIESQVGTTRTHDGIWKKQRKTRKTTQERKD